MRRQRGVTLIELMIVVVIVAIAASISVSSYRRYVMRAQRTDATTALLRASSAQERFFLQNRRYMNAADLTAAGLDASEHGYYTIAIASPDPARPGLPGFVLTATATAGTPQAADSACATFTVNDLSDKGSAPEPVATCWR
ncbi:MAG TPA: type IV pilin protein [Steroidobacteraceae bacterium]|nr:type IV pilin protein [Steroidobacteraceae bacterium]